MTYVKRLYRSAKNRLLGGICSGLGQYFNLDVNILRLIWVTVALIWPATILAYLIMWIIIPHESAQPEPEVMQAATA